MNFFRGYVRWRHSKGFGIHSPFAFRIVQEVIDNPYGFYGFDDIEASLESERRPRHIRRMARMLLRLANFLHTDAVYLSPNVPETYATALLAAVPRARFFSRISDADKASLIVTPAEYGSNPFLSRAINTHGKTILLLNQPETSIRALLKDFREGLILHDIHDAIIFPRPAMSRITYSIRLR